MMMTIDEWMEIAGGDNVFANGACEGVVCDECPFKKKDTDVCGPPGDGPDGWRSKSFAFYRKELLRKKLDLL